MRALVTFGRDSAVEEWVAARGYAEQGAALLASPRAALTALAQLRQKWTADLAVLSALLVLTAMFGRSFAKAGPSGHTIFITEIFLVAVVFLAVRRCGLRGSWQRVRARIPLVPLLVFWAAGAIATVRGLAGYGVGHVLHDIGLAEYSIMLPIVAVVADSRERALRLVRVLVFAGFAAAVTYLIALRVTSDASFGAQNPGSAVAIYLSLIVFVTAARLLTGVRAGIFGIVGSLLALWAMADLGARSVVPALAVGFAVLIIMLPRHKTAAVSVAFVGAAVAIAGPWALEGFPKAAVIVPSPVVQSAVASPDFVADDGMSAFSGGELVTGETARGRLARELQPGERLTLTALPGLRPGRTYSVEFWVKPLDASVLSFGTVGSTLPGSWGGREWHVLPIARWQRFRVQLVATGPSEQLVMPNYGPSPVLVDAISVLAGTRPGPGGGLQVQQALASPSFVADDLLSAFQGGSVVRGGAAAGAYARKLRPGEQLELLALPGLRRGRTYTVEFWVKPLDASVPSGGTVGSTLPGSWGSQEWHALPTARWQRFRARLVAAHSHEQLVLANVGRGPVLVDALAVADRALPSAVADGRVTPALANPPESSRPSSRPPHVPVTARPLMPSPGAVIRAVPPPPLPKPGLRESLPPILVRIYDTFNPNDTSGSSANASWRVAIWGYMVRKWLHEPALGVGFGRPTNFLWGGILYDSRRGSGSWADVTGPHNSFIDILFREGIFAILALLALVFVAARRVIATRTAAGDSRLSAALIAIAALFAFTVAISSLNVALEGPYMGIYFWTLLGLFLVVPQFARNSGSSHDQR
jgi:O-Antigen ligase